MKTYARKQEYHEVNKNTGGITWFTSKNGGIHELIIGLIEERSIQFLYRPNEDHSIGVRFILLMVLLWNVISIFIYSI